MNILQKKMSSKFVSQWIISTLTFILFISCGMVKNIPLVSSPDGGSDGSGGDQNPQNSTSPVPPDPVIDAPKTKTDPPKINQAIHLTAGETVTLEEKFSKNLAPSFKPLCFTRNSNFVPSILMGENLGIRYGKPEAFFSFLAKDKSQTTILEPGWTLTVYPNVTGTAFPDFSKIQGKAQLMDVPDLPSLTVLGNTTRNFAIRSKTDFNMPIGRTMQYQLQAASVARLLIDDKVVATTAVTTGGGNRQPPVLSGSVDLKAGPHTAVLEYVNGNLAPVFRFNIRLAGEPTYVPAMHSGALPFSVAKTEALERNEDPSIMRATLWPNTAGSEVLTQCNETVMQSSASGAGESGFIEKYTDTNATTTSMLIRVREQATNYGARGGPEQVGDFWVSSSEQSEAAFSAVAISTDKVVIFFRDTRHVSIPIADMVGSANVDPSQTLILGAGASGELKQDGFALFAYGQPTQLALLEYLAQENKVAVTTFPLPSGFQDRPAVVGSMGNFILAKFGSQVIAITSDAKQLIKIAAPFEIKTTKLFSHGLALTGAQNEVYIIRHHDLIQGLTQASQGSSEAKSIDVVGTNFLAKDGLPAENKNYWIDSFQQIWTLSDRMIKVMGQPTLPLILYSVNTGNLYFSDEKMVNSLQISVDGKAVDNVKTSSSVSLRSLVQGDLASFASLRVEVNEKTAATIPMEYILGQATVPAPPKSSDAPKPSSTPVPSTTPVPDKVVSFTKDVAPIIQQSCLGAGCHSRPNPQAGLPLETKADVQVKISSIIGITTSGSMPRNRPRLTPAQIQVFKDWSVTFSD